MYCNICLNSRETVPFIGQKFIILSNIAQSIYESYHFLIFCENIFEDWLDGPVIFWKTINAQQIGCEEGQTCLRDSRGELERTEGEVDAAGLHVKRVDGRIKIAVKIRPKTKLNFSSLKFCFTRKSFYSPYFLNC